MHGALASIPALHRNTQSWWCIPVTPALGGRKQEDQKFKDILNCIESSGPSWATLGPCFKKCVGGEAGEMAPWLREIVVLTEVLSSIPAPTLVESPAAYNSSSRAHTSSDPPPHLRNKSLKHFKIHIFRWFSLLCWFSSALWNLFLKPWVTWPSERFSSPKNWSCPFGLDLVGLIQIA